MQQYNILLELSLQIAWHILLRPVLPICLRLSLPFPAIFSSSTIANFLCSSHPPEFTIGLQALAKCSYQVVFGGWEWPANAEGAVVVECCSKEVVLIRVDDCELVEWVA